MNIKIIKNLLILGIAAAAVIIAVETMIYQKSKPICKNCNVLLISIDTLAAKHLQCYGYERETAPNLCKFGSENFLFSNSYSQSNWTRPSQTSVLTGLHPTTHGVLIPFTTKLDKKYKTIAEMMKYYGYKTYYFGPAPDNDSWDKSVVRGFDYSEENIYQGSSIDHWYKALETLEKNQKDKIPTFMYLHTYYVHAPYTTGKDNLKFVKDEDRLNYPDIPLTELGYHTLKPDMAKFVMESLESRVKGSNTAESLKRNTEMLSEFKAAKDFEEQKLVWNNFPGNEIESYARTWYFNKFKENKLSNYVRDLYDERVHQIDRDLSYFLDALKNKFDKDTIVIFYADHGETVGERGSYGHCENFPDCLYMETIKVPLIIRVPGLKGKKIDELAQGIDIYPTILKLLGKQVPNTVEGEDLSGLMTGKESISKKEFVISESGGDRATIIDKKWSMYIRDLAKYKTESLELYDLENDKNQLTNAAEKYPEVVSKMIERLKSFSERQQKIRQGESVFPDWVDDVKKEKMKREGYF